MQPDNPADPTRSPGNGPDAAPSGGPYAGTPEAGAPQPGWTPGHPPYVVRRPTNGMALASMITGIVGLLSCPLLGVVALYLAKRAREEIRTSGEEGEGFATAGVVIGWIGVALSVLTILLVLGYLGVVGVVIFSTTQTG